MTINAHCFICSARITADNLVGEQDPNPSVLVRRYECPFCAAEHTIRAYAGAATTGVGPKALMISRAQAASEMDDLSSAVANACGVPVPMNFLADLSQALGFWADGDLQGPWLDEYQRIRALNNSA